MNTQLKALLVTEIPVAVEKMTSLEIVKLINMKRELDGGFADLQHRNFMAKVPQVLGQGGVIRFKHSYFNSQNKEQPCFNFPRREAMLMMMSYDYDLQAAVYDRMIELEEAIKNPQVVLPDFTDPAAAAIAWANEYQQKTIAQVKVKEQEKELSIAAPKTLHYDTIVDKTGLILATAIAQKVGLTAQRLNKYLEAKRVYNRTIKSTKAFNKWFIEREFGIIKQTSNGCSQTMFTTKGEAWIVDQLIKDRVIKNTTNSITFTRPFFD